MIDPNDKKTIELEYETPVYGSVVTVPNINEAPPQYRAYLTTTDGITLAFTHLSRSRAILLQHILNKNFNILQSSTEITRTGWEEM